MKRKTNPRRSKVRGIGPLLRIILQRGAGKCYFVDYSKKLPNGTFTECLEIELPRIVQKLDLDDW